MRFHRIGSHSSCTHPSDIHHYRPYNTPRYHNRFGTHGKQRLAHEAVERLKKTEMERKDAIIGIDFETIDFNLIPPYWLGVYISN